MLFGCYPFGDPQQSETPITAVITVRNPHLYGIPLIRVPLAPSTLFCRRGLLWPLLHAADEFTPSMQRITRAEYNIPPGENISDDCRDLLAKIFVPRPSERISISGIRSHAFFTKDLPWEFQVSHPRILYWTACCPLVNTRVYVSSLITCLQVNAPLSIPPRQTDEETLNIITAARSPDQSMGVPLWANDIVPMMDIEPQLMSHMTTDLGSSISVDSEWDLTANELQV